MKNIRDLRNSVTTDTSLGSCFQKQTRTSPKSFRRRNASAC